MKENDRLLSIVLLMISPFLSIINTLRSCWIKNYQFNILIIAFTYGLMAYNYVPLEGMDFHSITLSAERISDNFDFGNFYNLRYFFDLTIYFLIKNNISLQVLPFISTFFSVLFLLKSVSNIIDERDGIKSNIFIVFTLLSLFSFMYSANGIRNGLACCLFVYITTLERSNIIKLWSISVLVICIHYFLIPPLIILIFSSFFQVRKDVKITLLITSIIISFFDLSHIFASLGVKYILLEFSIDSYVSNSEFGTNRVASIYMTYLPMLTYYMLIPLMIYASKFDNKTLNTGFFIMCIALILNDFYTISVRYYYLGSLLVSVGIISIEKNKLVSSNKYQILLGYIFIISMFGTIWGAYRFILVLPSILKGLFYPPILNII
ncbi:EpsG family protein [Moellerella wisconsensis]|uniref:EpsG family protein n=1 Tax=Moellerella wisconsensis TaxID=158849 RepID=UPI00307634DC